MEHTKLLYFTIGLVTASIWWGSLIIWTYFAWNKKSKKPEKNKTLNAYDK